MASTTRLAVVFRKQGRYAEAEKLTRATLESQRKLYGEAHPSCAFSVYNLAAIAAAQGKRDEALALLQNALSDNLAPQVIAGIPSDPDLKPLHGDPRFDRLLEEARKRAEAAGGSR
jgi:tetratricopeptide (TPR) repeat protein